MADPAEECQCTVVWGLTGRAPLMSHQQLVMFSFPSQTCRMNSALPAAGGLGYLGYLWHWHPSVLAQGVQGTDTRWPGQGKPQPPPPPDSSMALGTELKEEKASPERCSGVCTCACHRQPQGFLTTGAVTADTLRV